jgi:hypothetical protein
MARSYYLVRCDGQLYASEELFTAAVAKGERAFIKMLAGNAVSGKVVLGEKVYPLTDKQLKTCKEYRPITQDFDDTFKHINVLSKETVREIKKGDSQAFPGATVITTTLTAIPERFKYRQAVFFKVSDYKEAKKYAMVPKMASVKICGRLYVALNAVNVRVETPIIVTADS